MTEPCGTLACIYSGVDNSPNTEIQNFYCERSKVVSLIKVVENANVDDL
jgi:hypothetical protein